MNYYPRSMQYSLKALNSYSRQKYKLSPNISESQTLKAGDTLIVTLPENSIVDISSFLWFFEGKCSANGYAFPKHIETIIDKLTIEVNGRMLNGISSYNLLFRRLADYTLGDKEKIRGVLQNTVSVTLAGTTNNTSYRQFAVKNWLGFLGTVQPQCLDTSLFGTIRVHITLSPNSILRKFEGATQNGSYEIKSNYFSVDCISLNDGVYHDIINKRLANEEDPIQVPYSTWTHFSEGVGNLTGQTVATLTTESLDTLLGTYTSSNWASQTDDEDLKAPAFFATGSSNIEESSFSINNVPYPTLSQKPHDALESTLQALNIHQDILGGTENDLDSLEKFKTKYFMHGLKLNHPSSSEERFKSGMNLRGTNSTITFNTKGNEANVVRHLWCGHTSVLLVKPYKQVEEVP